MSKKLINTYVTYTSKKPLIVISVILLGMFLILYMTLSTKTNIIKTYNGSISGNSVTISAKLDKIPDMLYIYKDRNEAIYSVKVVNAEHKAKATVIAVSTDSQTVPFKESDHIKVDIPIGEITLFERVFLKGGKSNNE